MTLTYALVADRGIVLAADSELTFTQSATSDFHGEPFTVGTYRSKRSKIYRLKNGSAFSVAGNEGLVEMLIKEAEVKQVDENKPFFETVKEYSTVFQTWYLDTFDYGADRPNCDFQFCGYLHGKCPMIITLSSKQNFAVCMQSKYFAFTGRENHGAALYLHHRLAHEEMPFEATKRLAYRVVAEVADMDNMVGKPIEMVVVGQSGTTEVGAEDFVSFEATRNDLVNALISAFELCHQDPPRGLEPSRGVLRPSLRLRRQLLQARPAASSPHN